jgi:hypothetical protein
VQTLVDHLYAPVAVALIAAVALVAFVSVRRIGGRASVGPVLVVAVALLVLGLEPMRHTPVPAADADVERPAEGPVPATGPAATPAPVPAPDQTVPPPPMRRVPVPTTTTPP